MNRADKRKFHIIYKTTCLITGKFYLGMHSTDNLNDGYKGSGSILSRSIKKHGKDNHACEILEFLPDRKSLALREEQIITPELRANKMCMNIRSGGTGNPPGYEISDVVRKKVSDGLKKTWAERIAKGFKAPAQTAETIAKRADALRGKKRSAASKQRMRDAQAKYYSTLTLEKKKSQHANRSNAKAKKWKVITESGEILMVDNLKKFAEEKGIRGTMLHKTVFNNRFVNGFKALGLLIENN